MNLTISEWHDRFSLQSNWSKEIRGFMFKEFQLSSVESILEVGCGTGAILEDISNIFTDRLVGLDINPSYLEFAKSHISQAAYICGDGLNLPFPNDSFGLSYCHFLLLWVSDPLAILMEMVRVTRPGSLVFVMAEPDYGGRIDFPEILIDLGLSQMEALIDQGADPLIGRRLAHLLSESGLVNVHTGVIGSRCGSDFDEDAFNSEWQILRADLENRLGKHYLDQMEEIDLETSRAGTRILFVPTFYGWGVKE